MTSKQRHQMSLLGIDLNDTVTYSNDEGNQEATANELQIQLPDLNYTIEEGFVIDFNCRSSPTNEIPSSQFLFDLNKEPCVEDDTEANFEVEEVAEPNLNSDNNMNDEPANSELAEAQSHDSIRKSRELTNEERKRIHYALLKQNVMGKLMKGTLRKLASTYSVSARTIQRIWKHAQDSGDVSQRKTKNCGRKRVQIDIARFREIPLSRRTTIRSLSSALRINQTSLFRYLKSGVIRRHSNAIKPYLKEENKRCRLQFCLSMLESCSIPHDPTFIGMYNIIHIDEKWFYMSKKSENYYLLSDEEEPLRTCKSKNFIPKVMFLSAISRPRIDAERNEIFTGKIGIFPFVTQEPARRTSVNRCAGTLETKPITSVNKEVIKVFLIEKVLPAIRAKWPRDNLRQPIFIQQDNARTHIDIDDNDFCRAAAQDGFDIRLMYQPANSPDLNVLDLGFFRAIQSLQHKEAPTTIDELVSAVVKSFEDFSTVESNRIFLTLQTCMIEIMKVKGSNKYKIPHIKKAVLERNGQLPTQMKCDPTLVQEVLQYLSS